MASVFTKIINGEIPCYRIAEDEDCFAFLDINPLQQGHTLVIPKKETDYIFDLDDEMTAKLHLFAKKVAKAIKSVITCERIGVVVLGMEVPHAHIHLIPINSEQDINFANPRVELTQDEFADLAEKIRENFKA